MGTRLVIFIFSLTFFLLPDVSAQQIISTHDRDRYPNNLFNSEFKSQVKSVKITMYDDGSDSTRSYQYICTYNSKGLLMQEITIYYRENYTDTIDRKYSYDSLDRPFSIATTICSKYWRECRNSYQELVYDSLGHYSHSIFTYDNSEPEPSFRCFYNEYGQYIRCEYRPTAEEHELGYNYDLMQQVFRYDNHGNCIEKVELVDGDTVDIERNSYDENGNVIEYSYQSISNDPYTLRDIYHYNSDNLLIKTERFNDNTLQSVSRYEYDEQQLLQLGITYNNKGEIDFSYRCRYDERHNMVETIDFDSTGKVGNRFTYEYEYYE